MSYMDIPYELDETLPLPACRFKSIWKVMANDTYQVAKPNGFSSPGLFVTHEGTGRLTLSGVSHSLDAGTYMIVPSGLPSTYQCQGGDWKFYFLEFDTLGMAQQLELPVGIPVSSTRIAAASRISERLIDGLILKHKGFEYTSHLSLQELLLLFAREMISGNGSRHPELDNVLFHMHKNIGQTIPVDEWVKLSGLSRTVFFSRFRSRTGMSPTRYMLELKLASAKTALETTNVSVKEIAASLQFYDEFHFSKLFKQQYGCSPRTYRQRLASED